MVRTFSYAKVERVIDGSTILCEIDLGFAIKFREIIKLCGMKVENKFTEEGAVSWSQLSALCSGAEVEIFCHGRNSDDQWIADVVLKNSGYDLAEEMIRLGCAREPVGYDHLSS
jgi:endonuclease YncB( thermonuclease family)